MIPTTLEGIRRNPQPLYPPGPIAQLWMWGRDGADLRSEATRTEVAAELRATFRAYHDAGGEEKIMPYLHAADAIATADWPRLGVRLRLEERARWQKVLAALGADRRQHEQLLAIATELEGGQLRAGGFPAGSEL